MFNAILIAPSPDLSRDVAAMCAELGQVQIAKTLDLYPSSHEIARLFNTVEARVVLLELGVSEEALHVARQIRVLQPDACIVGLSAGRDCGETGKAGDAGVNEVLRAPFGGEDLQRVVGHALGAWQERERGRVLAFLPAKAGSGASTAALSLAGALARDGKANVCLLEADLHSGLLTLLLDLRPSYSILDALENAEALDEGLWSRYISQAHGIDVLGTPLAKRTQLFSPWHYRQLLGFARERYDFVIVDLPEVVNDATEAIVQEAARAFVVCTAEMPSLFLARRRIFELQSRQVSDSSIGVVLNRCISQDRHVEDAERVLGRKMSAVLPNDYAAVQEAIKEARPIQGGSEIARAFINFARSFGQSDPEREHTGGVLSRWLRLG